MVIGGKIGVNFNGKNMIGMFYFLNFVLIVYEIFFMFLEEEIRNGFGEVVKYVLFDRKVYVFVRNFEGISEIFIRECVFFKVEVVEKDLGESGLRRIFNFGYIVGYVIEKLLNYRIKYGFVVLMGFMVVLKVGEEFYGFDFGKIEEFLKKFGFFMGYFFRVEEILEEMRFDKKVWYGRIIFVILVEIGDVVVEEVDEVVLKRVLEVMRDDSGSGDC